MESFSLQETKYCFFLFVFYPFTLLSHPGMRNLIHFPHHPDTHTHSQPLNGGRDSDLLHFLTLPHWCYSNHDTAHISSGNDNNGDLMFRWKLTHRGLDQTNDMTRASQRPNKLFILCSSLLSFLSHGFVREGVHYPSLCLDHIRE